ncbi:MAG: S9 family peptidase [Muribaculaceae bacterium]|nr:S9 family peptidase [Muribaculaceae bacterium]
MKYTSKLTYEGHLFDMLVFPGMDHSIRKGNARTMLYKRVVDFLNTNLGK